MLSLIAIGLYLLVDFIYDYACSGYSTNWSIFYFSMTNLSFTLIAFDVIYREYSKTLKYTALSFGLYIMFYIFWELKFINVPFDEYILKVNDTGVNKIAGIVLASVLICITITAWVKRRLKR